MTHPTEPRRLRWPVAGFVGGLLLRAVLLLAMATGAWAEPPPPPVITEELQEFTRQLPRELHESRLLPGALAEYKAKAFRTGPCSRLLIRRCRHTLVAQFVLPRVFVPGITPSPPPSTTHPAAVLYPYS